MQRQSLYVHAVGQVKPTQNSTNQSGSHVAYIGELIVYLAEGWQGYQKLTPGQHLPDHMSL